MAKVTKTPGSVSWTGKIASVSFEATPTPEWSEWAKQIMARCVIRVEVGGRAFEFDVIEARELDDGRWAVDLRGGRDVTEGKR